MPEKTQTKRFTLALLQFVSALLTIFTALTLSILSVTASFNGTSVNGQSIDDKGFVSVDSGDQIIIGSVVMKLQVMEG